MKVSLNWIKEYVDELNASAEDIAGKIQESLSEVENIEDLSQKYKDIIVAEITDKEDHPNADKLGVYKITIGKEEKIQVVAGDKELNVGDRVVYLPPNIQIPYNPYPNKFDGIIRPTKLRGIDSNGMLASEKELGLSNNHDRVLVLTQDYKVGESFAEQLNLNDYILEIENKPLTIRPETFGIIGMAREISGIFHKPFTTPEWLSKPEKLKPETPSTETLPLKVHNKLDSLCPRYMAISMKNIQVTESPLWLKVKLATIGVKPVNNVVDITNYLMILTGQPLHAFDYDKLITKDIHAKDKAFITVRTAKEGEKLTTLDGKTIKLTDKNVVICDSQNPIAIGGIMGGLDTEIDENTQNIIIESANFDLYNIRRSSMALGLFTDAATRFSKGQDPNLCEPVLYKAIQLIEEFCEGKIASKVQDEHSELPKPHKLTFSVEKLNKHIGLKLSRKQITSLLENIEIKEIKTKDKDLVTLEVPTYRQDVRIPEDVHEEVARLYGYKNIELTLPTRNLAPAKMNKTIQIQRRIRKILSSIGANELLTYNFVGEELYKNCDLELEHNYRLTNPISPELEYMRTSLLPSLLERVNLNINNGYTEFALFELNKVHNKLDIQEEDQLPQEHPVLSLLYCKDTKSPFYDAKFMLSHLFERLNCADIFYESLNKINKDKLPNQIKITLPMFDLNKTAIVYSEINKRKVYLGLLGEPNLGAQENLKLKQNVGMFEINVNALEKILDLKQSFINYSKFPKIQQDFCFILDKDIPYNILVGAIESALKDREINYLIKPVDIYQKEEETKQITVNVTIQHQNKTLKDKDINSLRKLIEKKVFKSTKGKLKTED